jgi:hypothetical protein
VIIQAKTQTKKKVFRAFETAKTKQFKPLNSPAAWLALRRLSC